MTGTSDAMTTLASAYVLRDEKGAIWIAEVPQHVQPGGVMPHLAPGDTAAVVTRTADDIVQVRISRHVGTSETDINVKAVRVSGAIATELQLLLDQ
ncbi:MAG TPA: hypothetical protein VH395_08410 [Jatrophihabitantaceae bacterium]|jgi:hypothetical protein